MVFASSDFGESFILEWVALIIIAVLVVRYAVPPLRRMINAKSESIRTQLAAGDEARQAAAALLEQRRSELDAAKSEATGIVEQARRSAEQIDADGRQRASAEHDRIVSHAAVQINLERNRMREEVMVEMSSLVLGGAHRLVDAELDVDRHRQLIDESIDAVESQGAQ